ncbi:hypothetical protein H4S07_002926 [Coemansia furcata]|uniref:Uncharacterized protein n=1 Tax=Coemansia furcata TaxID=417177 RepID=A0ACC1LI83_9FUNG|nr:hypothetical protein H4S07_002926 [Coemansia furcata]
MPGQRADELQDAAAEGARVAGGTHYQAEVREIVMGVHRNEIAAVAAHVCSRVGRPLHLLLSPHFLFLMVGCFDAELCQARARQQQVADVTEIHPTAIFAASADAQHFQKGRHLAYGVDVIAAEAVDDQ